MNKMDRMEKLIIACIIFNILALVAVNVINYESTKQPTVYHHIKK